MWFYTKLIGALTSSAILLIVVVSSTATDDKISIEQEITFLLKALSYDRNLEKRSGEQIHIAIVHKKDSSSAEAIAETFNGTGVDGVKGLTIKAEAVAFESVAKILKQIDRKKFNLIYVHDSMASGLSSIQQVSRAKKIPSICSSGRFVKNGLSIGVFSESGKPKLAVNLRSTKVEGLALSAELLRISKVIR